MGVGASVSNLVIESRPIAALAPYPRNARTHSDAQVAQLAASIKEFGWTNPVLVDEANGVIAGHGRLLAAKSLGLAEVPVIVLSGLSEAQRRALVLADNKLALNAGWDMQLLAAELTDLRTVGVDLGLLGFSEVDLASLLVDRTAGLTDPDEVPATPVNPVTRPGDLWLLGRHRLLCGDSTSADAVGRLLGPVKPHLMVTDPPYGVSYDPDWRNRAEGVGGFGDPQKSRAGYKSSRAVGLVQNDDRADWREAWALFPGDVTYVWHGALHATLVADSLAACGFEVRAQIIWKKDRLVIGRGHYHWTHEPCWYAVRKGGTGHWAGDRKQTTVWEIAHRKSETGHGTQKPVECMKRPIENNSLPGQAVYEPFSGSGTTIIAAETTGRSCLAMELDPAYVDVAVQRWQDFTGEKATLEGDGRTFEQMLGERYDPAKDSAESYDVAIGELRKRKEQAKAKKPKARAKA